MVSNIRHQTKKQSQQKPNRWTALYIHSTSEVLCPIIVISPLFVEVYFSTLALSFINWDSHQSSCSSLWTVHRGFWSGATRDAAFQRVKQHLYLEAVHIGTNIQVLVIDAAAATVLVGIVAVGWLLSLLSLSSLLLMDRCTRVLLLWVLCACRAPQLVQFLHVATRFTSQSPGNPGLIV